MAELPPPLEIYPPLINSANPWATTLDDLRRLYACPSTGAVTTRTSLLRGFNHSPGKHQYTFFDASTHKASPNPDPNLASTYNASLNSFGYSPLPLETYLAFIKTISDEQQSQQHQAHTKSRKKGFIISVTGSPDEIAGCYSLIASAAQDSELPLAMEINLSCPNIPGSPPPAYSRVALTEYLEQLQHMIADDDPATAPAVPSIPVGLKTPPYTHASEYEGLVAALDDAAGGGVCPISFITATNTLGSCLVFAGSESGLGPGNGEGGREGQSEPRCFALPGTGMGGLAGAPLHPLALGNVCTLRRMLDERGEKLRHIRIIGVGGVLDAEGYRRMRAVGAYAVGVGTGLGLKGVGIFGEIERGLGGTW